MSSKQYLKHTGIGYIKPSLASKKDLITPSLYALEVVPCYWQNKQDFSAIKAEDFKDEAHSNVEDFDKDKVSCSFKICFPDISNNEQWQGKLNTLGKLVTFTLIKEPQRISSFQDDNSLILTFFCYDDLDKEQLNSIQLDPINNQAFYEIVQSQNTIQNLKATHSITLANKNLVMPTILVAIKDKVIGPFNFQRDNYKLKLSGIECDYYYFVAIISALNLQTHCLNIDGHQIVTAKVFKELYDHPDRYIDFISADQLIEILSKYMDSCVQFNDESLTSAKEILFHLIKSCYESFKTTNNLRINTLDKLIKFAVYNRYQFNQVLSIFLQSPNNKRFLLNNLLLLSKDKDSLTPANTIALSDDLYNRLLNKLLSESHKEEAKLQYLANLRPAKLNTYGYQDHIHLLDDPMAQRHLALLIEHGNKFIATLNNGLIELDNFNLKKEDANSQRLCAHELLATINVAALYLGFINDILGLLRCMENGLIQSNSKIKHPLLTLTITRLSNISLKLNNFYADITSNEAFNELLPKLADNENYFDNSYYDELYSTYKSISALSYLNPKLFLANNQSIEQGSTYGKFSQEQPLLTNSTESLDDYKAQLYETQTSLEYHKLLINETVKLNELNSAIEQAQLDLLETENKLAQAKYDYQEQLIKNQVLLNTLDQSLHSYQGQANLALQALNSQLLSGLMSASSNINHTKDQDTSTKNEPLLESLTLTSKEVLTKLLHNRSDNKQPLQDLNGQIKPLQDQADSIEPLQDSASNSLALKEKEFYLLAQYQPLSHYDNGNNIIDKVYSYLKDQGYQNFSYADTTNILICLTQGFITTLSGPPGCGKTTLSRLIANALGLGKANEILSKLINEPSFDQELSLSKEPHLEQSWVDNLDRFTEISVEKGWISVKDFVGYFNPITNSLEKSNALAFDAFDKLNYEALNQSINQHSYPYLMLLDEANLSSLEQYWAPLLSACDINNHHRAFINLGGDHKFIIPKHLRFLATINNDHTAEPLTARFIDRSFIIALDFNNNNKAQSEHDLVKDNPNAIITYEQLMRAFNSNTTCQSNSLNPSEPHDLATLKWIEIQELFKQNRFFMPLSMRSCHMVERYCNQASLYMRESSNNSSFMAFDYAFSQKILPTIKGMGDRYQELIEQLLELCPYQNMPLSHTHLQRMYMQGNESMYYHFFSF